MESLKTPNLLPPPIKFTHRPSFSRISAVFLYLEDRVSFLHPVFPSSGLLLLSSLSRRRMTLLTRLLILLSSLRLSRTTLLPALKEPPIFIQRIDDFSKTYGLSDKERALRRRLNKIAENADTSTLNGVNYVLKEVVKVLQNHNSSIHFTKLNTDYGFLKSLSKAYEEFINREHESHGKVENIFANIDDNVEYKNEGSMVKANSSIENEYTVVTLLVLATGRHLIPNFKGKGARYQKSLEVLQAKGDRGRCYDSFEVLQTLERIPKNELQSVEVLWSPRKEDKVLLEDELLRDFPRLIPIENGLLYGKVEA